ncbi:hypothetical protein IPA_05610 [Ignicoccus pacificus DSM 13166]|uniref:Molybdopterin-guanine dinucleotide biosynthesis protein B (MobB) domain-containing protein n=1 Tax=Ignicoccus pacificus DSM 13166 TaxID=940294 RepID=A0A977KBE8_9CREN|nr:hypothetical protein IPA_05610 [Ignicoccus pacificus DSM 13166]
MKLVIQVVGFRKRGKSTLIEYLLEELKKYGLKAKVVKETKHGLLDVDSGDTKRFTSRGAEEVYLLCKDGIRFQKMGRPSLEELVDSLDGLIIVEGGKSIKRRDWYAVLAVREGWEEKVLWKPLVLDVMRREDSARVKAIELAKRISVLYKALSCPVASFTHQHSANSSSPDA